MLAFNPKIKKITIRDKRLEGYEKIEVFEASKPI